MLHGPDGSDGVHGGKDRSLIYLTDGKEGSHGRAQGAKEEG